MKGEMNMQPTPAPYGPAPPSYGQGSDRQQGYQRWSWGIVVLGVFALMLCQCLGIVSLLTAMAAYTDHKAKDYDGEQRKRGIAKSFGIAAVVIGLISIVFIIIVYTVLIITY